MKRSSAIAALLAVNVTLTAAALPATARASRAQTAPESQTTPGPQPVPPVQRGAPAGALAPDAEPGPDAGPPPEPWPGTLAEGLAEARKLAGEERLDEAQRVLDRLLVPQGYAAWRAELDGDGDGDGGFGERAAELALDPLARRLGFAGPPRPHKAEVWFAKGVVALHAGDVAAADEAFGRARAMAGPGAPSADVAPLRHDAVYNLGVTHLFVAEALFERAKDPSAAGGPAQPQGAPAPPPSAPPGGAPGAGGTQAVPDPIQLARAAYLRAREPFVERLRLDWRDADTRANVELVQRRLRELDELEQQREQEQQEEQQQDEEQQEPSDEQEQEESDEEQPPEDEQEPQEEPQEPEEPEEPEEDSEETDEPPAAEPQEVHLTREEMMQLLEKLQRIEEEKEQVKEQLYRKRRVPVKRDW